MTLSQAQGRQKGVVNALWCATGCVLFLSVWVGVVQADAGQADASGEVRTFSQLRLLPREQALKARRARFQGTVLCYDPAWGQLYVYDGSETKYFRPGAFPVPLEKGFQVEIRGTTTFVNDTTALTNLQLVVQGRAELPRPAPLELRDLAKEFGQWIETSGRVRVADTSWGRLALAIEDQGHSCLVFVMGMPAADNSFKRFVGARVRVRGINASKISKGRLQSASIFAPGLSEVTVLEPAHEIPERLPVVSIDSLLNRPLGAWTNEMVHLNGFIAAYEPGAFVQIKDPTGLIRVQIMQMTRARLDEWVDAWGFLSVSPNQTSLKDGYFELVRLRPQEGPPVPAPGTASGGTGTNRTITGIAEVLKLGQQEAARGIPVRLRGVITFADPDWHNAFLENTDAAVYVDLKGGAARAGQWVELTGQTARGGFAPEVDHATIQVLGATNLPSPIQATLADLADGRWDAHWVELEGLVRGVHEEWGHVTLSLVTPQGRFKAIIPNPGKQAPPDCLIDALVRVRGACSTELNSRGQVSGVVLHVPGIEQIRIQEAAPSDPFAIRGIPINTVATFDPERVTRRRVKVSGVVTLPIAGQGFYLQDASGGIRISTQQTNQLRAGDAVEVLGFPTVGDFGPVLEEPALRRTGAGPLPAAKPTTAEQILLRGTEDGMLVQLEARLLQDVSRAAAPRLVLQDGPLIFTAELAGHASGSQMPAWRSGSIVRLTGICDIHGTDNHEPQAFRLLLAKAASVKLVRPPPWWTVQHTLMLVGGLTLSILIATGWIGLLRRQVRRQTDVIRQNHQQLAESSRQAGMAEVATSVLHNVGNVLNSVNTSAGVLSDQIRASKAREIGRVSQLLQEHRTDLAGFLTPQDRAETFLGYLKALTQQVETEQATALRELQELTGNIDHIKEIVAMQQSYATVSGVMEVQSIPALVEDALRMHAEALSRHRVRVVRQFEPVPRILVDKHKVLQILINLISNAKYALNGSTAAERRLTLGVHLNGDNLVRISVADNGLGIAAENLTRIFAHGFTTRSNGHGFGLHSGALAAREMGGALRAHSEGPGKGATFTLELPAQPKTPPS